MVENIIGNIEKGFVKEKENDGKRIEKNIINIVENAKEEYMES